MIEEMSDNIAAIRSNVVNVVTHFFSQDAAITGDEALVSQLIGRGEVTVDWRGGLFTPL